MQLTKKKGFTLIEIVIVLAIAALILVIVFLAVSGAQVARRNEQRRNDAARALAAYESTAANSSGTYPTSGTAPTSFVANEPKSGTAYTFAAAVPAGAVMQYITGNKCGTAGALAASTGANNVAVRVELEPTATYYCVSNNQ